MRFHKAGYVSRAVRAFRPYTLTAKGDRLPEAYECPFCKATVENHSMFTESVVCQDGDHYLEFTGSMRESELAVSH